MENNKDSQLNSVVIEDISETETEIYSNRLATHRSAHTSRVLLQPIPDHIVSNIPVIEETLVIEIDQNIEDEEVEKRDKTKDEMQRENTVIDNNISKELTSNDAGPSPVQLTSNGAGPSPVNYVNKSEPDNDSTSKPNSLLVEDINSNESFRNHAVTKHDATEYESTVHDATKLGIYEPTESAADYTIDASLLEPERLLEHARLLERGCHKQYVDDQSNSVAESERDKTLFEKGNTRLYVHRSAEDRLSVVTDLDTNWRPNWLKIEDPESGDGIATYQTAYGVERFKLTTDLEYFNPPSTFRLSSGCQLQDNPSLYFISANCDLNIDNDIWKLQLDTDLENNLIRMDIRDTLHDATGTSVWKLQLESDIENLVRGYFIAIEGVRDDENVQWAFSNDSSYNPKTGHFTIKDDAILINKIRKATIGKCGKDVQTRPTFSIPNPYNSEFIDHKRYMLNKDAVLSNKDRCVMSKDSKIVQVKCKWSLCKEHKEGPRTRREWYSIPAGGKRGKEKAKYSIFKKVILEDSSRFSLPRDQRDATSKRCCLKEIIHATLNKKRYSIPKEPKGIRKDRGRYSIPKERRGRVKQPNMFICSHGSVLVDIKKFYIADDMDVELHEADSDTFDN